MSDNESTGMSLEDRLRRDYGYLPEAALQTFIDAYINDGPDWAWGAVRSDPRYEQWFPANRLDDGQVRYTEREYFAIRESYRDTLRAVGLEPTAIQQLEDRIIELMRGEVSPSEFDSRVMSVSDRILSSSDQIKRYYADSFGISDLSTEDLLLGALDPTLGDEVLNSRLRVAEIGGSASEFNFTVDSARALALAERGMSLGQARQVFGEASQLVPVLDVLARRHSDPDDDFNLDDFLAADFFKDPRENLRMRRLIQQERSLFGAAPSFTTQGGRLTGLTAE